MNATCHVVELQLPAGDFPDRLSLLSLLRRLPEIGELRCVEVALGPAGGGRLSFVVLDGESTDSVRDGTRALVGNNAILHCTRRPA
jgi:hypothetical protein